ncbi:MAG: arginine deiminase family protein [Bacteroidales bacterium]
MFHYAIVRTPCRNMVQGITTAGLGLPDYKLACRQHEDYIAALSSCHVEVHVLPPLEEFPDSTFIEDVALITPVCGIITRPGAISRRGETSGMRGVLEFYFEKLQEIEAPGTVEAGDIMMVGSHYYIGLSERTNRPGAEQMICILESHGMTGSMVTLEKVLHLKTGLAYLEDNILVACGEFLLKEEFKKFRLIEIPGNESYAANCIRVNDKVLVPDGFPESRRRIEAAGLETIAVDVSEFRKLDGGLSCLSLRF